MEESGSDPVEALRAEKVARRRLDQLKAAGEDGLAWCYEKLILDRHPARRGKRNEWLTTVTPLLFHALSFPVATRVVEICYDIHAGIWSDPKAPHMESFRVLWEGCAARYESELSSEESAYYNELDGLEKKAAFRICRDLASKKEGVFFMPSDHLRWRTQADGWTILKGFQAHGVLKLIEPGQRRAKGTHAKAAKYSWTLSAPDAAAA